MPATFPLVECIPNFSEARRPEVVQAILAAISSAGVTVLDRHSDTDHNRTVITFLGAPAAVEEAAFKGIQKAAELINLDRHTGTHPRIGATDVVPFVPISGIGMKDCVAIARRLGERVGRELNIPVYLYEEAAATPERVNLENHRRGQYEGLRDEIETNLERKPDFGPTRLGPAGATVIGARHPLIAYNVYLDSDDVSIAKAVARAVRQSSGGLPCVKALGMLVEGRAQVSMNLTNFHQTSIQTAVDAVRIEASRHGVGIHHCELVGLIPLEALAESAARYLQLDGFKPEQILENRLFSLPKGGSQSSGFLDDLAAATPTPGGGAAAAYTGAEGAALVVMVARLTLGKKKYADVETQMKEILTQAERLRRDLTAAIEKDSAAFTAVLAAFKLPKETEAQEKARAETIETATLRASRVPLTVAQKSLRVMALAGKVVALGNLNAISDGASAAAMAHAALISAGYNVRINLAGLADKTIGEPLLSQLHTLEGKAVKIQNDIQKSIQERGRFSLA
jgi:glutamate formiminotransferase/formiminotetrahydrofolate cyclodeaminase